MHNTSCRNLLIISHCICNYMLAQWQLIIEIKSYTHMGKTDTFTQMCRITSKFWKRIANFPRSPCNHACDLPLLAQDWTHLPMSSLCSIDSVLARAEAPMLLAPFPLTNVFSIVLFDF